MLDFRIETFLAVCGTMNLTRAAEQLHLTQPAVSQHIRALEEQYQAKLFRYEGKRLSLTEAGQILLQAAATMRHDVNHLKKAIRQLSSRRNLRFGATLTIGEYSMPGPLLRILNKEPDIGLSMTMSNTAQLLRLLDQGDIDFAIVEGFYEKQAYDSLLYRRERYLPVCAPGCSLALGERKLEDLLHERLLIREPGSGTREVLERALEERNLTLRDFHRLTELGSLNVIKSLVCAGAGIAFFYEPAVAEELKSGKLREIPLRDLSLAHDFSFLWRKNSVFGSFYREMFRLFQPEESSRSPGKPASRPGRRER